jgi:type IV secretory pathway protease TraF
MSAKVPPLLAAGLSLGLLAVAQIDRAPRLIWNASASVPIGIYVVRASNPPSLGDLVAVRPPEDLSFWMVVRIR